MRRGCLSRRENQRLYRHGQARVDEVVELMLEVLLSRRDTIRIAGDELPAEVVKGRLMKVDPSHVEYVFESLDRNTTPIRNIKAYLLTALFNAPPPWTASTGRR